MATKTAKATTEAAPRFRCVMQQCVADVARNEAWFTRAFVTQRPAGKGVTNVLAATEADLTAAKAFFEAALPTLSGKAKQEVGNTLNKGWLDPALLVVYGEVTPKVAVAKPAKVNKLEGATAGGMLNVASGVLTPVTAKPSKSQNPRTAANKMVMDRAKAIAARSQVDA